MKASRKLLFLVIIVTTMAWGSFNGLAAGSSGGGQEGVLKTDLKTTDVIADVLYEELPDVTNELLAKATPDECYNGIGEPYPPGPPCEEGIEKVNEAYVWGLTKYEDQLWFGTAANVHCMVVGGYLSAPIPHETDAWVCEFGESQYSPPLPEALGDMRPPNIYQYDLETDTLVKMTPADPRVQTTLGIRSAGSHQGVVLMAGPSLQGGIDMYAYNGASGDYLGSTNLPEYTNIRKWVLVGDVLYTGVQNTSGGGHVLRWTGDLVDPFQFEVVGNLGSEGVELAEHAGRLYVSTWPNLQALPVVEAGIYMSPEIPAGGLTSADADSWAQVWTASDYEADPVTAKTYGGGALASFDGYLYWGTMHVPLTGALANFRIYGSPSSELDALATILGTTRAISIFRARDFGTPEEQVDLLYGETYLPVYEFDTNTATGFWSLQPNNMGVEPLWGSSGFGNFYNNYTWTMAVYDHQLFIGTMDWSYLFGEGVNLLLENILGLPRMSAAAAAEVDFPDFIEYGADLMKIESSAGPAEVVSLDGMGNYTNYGIRTMLPADALYLGTANPMNKLTDLTDDLPEGGWELRQLQTYHSLILPVLFQNRSFGD